MALWSFSWSAVPDPTTPYGAAKAAAETAIKGITPAAIIARTSLIIGDGNYPHERFVHALAFGAVGGVLFTDDVRCPVHVSDLARALLEFARSIDDTEDPRDLLATHGHPNVNAA
ncbi:MAG TPA: sugar nucleotide-binding protein [Acidothermaceae bacterium]